jgi:tetratricopeptide (TPR) repeat protein
MSKKTRSSRPPSPAAPAVGASAPASGRRRPPILLVGGLGLLLLAVIGAWSWWRGRSAAGVSEELPAADFVARLPQIDAGRWLIPTQAVVGTAASADLADHCREIDDHIYLGTVILTRLEARVRDARQAMAQGHDPQALKDLVSFGYALGKAYASRGDYQKALTEFESILPVAENGGPEPTGDVPAGGPDPAIRPQDIRRQMAATYLRMGESANCGQGTSPYLCLLTANREGGYAQPEEVQRAIAVLEDTLRRYPESRSARWLLNIGHMLLRSYPEGVSPAWLIPPERFAAQHELPRFPNIARELGLATVSVLGGALIEDLDEDGYLDVVTTVFDPCQHLNYFRNDGLGGFQERTAEAGLAGQLGGFNLQQTDFDNDGHLDLFITRGGWQMDSGRMRPSLLRNKGDGSFEDVTHAAGLDGAVYPTQASAWADYDLDGDLDLYIGNETSNDNKPYPSQLYRNNGDGTFTDVAEAAGVRNDRMTKSVAWGDYDDDGDPDLYASCIGPNRLYRNNGDGSFTDVAPALGVTEPSGRSFVAWFWDYNNDGHLDLYVGGYEATLEQIAQDYLGEMPSGGARPRLYRNDGKGGFVDVTSAAGLNIVRLPMGANFADVDNDGWLDFYLGTGDPDLSSLMPNELYWNDGGKRFLNATASADVGHLPKGHGIAFGDLDNDGDQELLVQAGGFGRGDASPNALFLNPGSANHFVVLQLRGKTVNRAAIGARLRLTVADGAGGRRDIHLVLDSGGSFGANSLQAEIGLGAATVVESLEVRWPGGPVETWKGLAVDRFYRVEEGAAEVAPLERRRLTLGEPRPPTGP